MFLIVGLGNPGKSYSNNRHNIGFKVVEKLEDTYKIPKFTKKFKSNFSKFIFDQKLLFLLKPLTYMNNSGIAVKEIKDFYNVNIKNIYVIHDEIDLNLGQVKIKNGGSHNGHNGLKSIDHSIGKGYNRIRIGVSRPSRIHKNQIDENISKWVLSDFSLEDKANWLDDTIEKVTKNIWSIIENEIKVS